MFVLLCSYVFVFNDTATTEIYTLSLHDALPICARELHVGVARLHAFAEQLGDLPAALEEAQRVVDVVGQEARARALVRSEEHTSELQSHVNLVCRLLLEKKKKNKDRPSRMYSSN